MFQRLIHSSLKTSDCENSFGIFPNRPKPIISAVPTSRTVLGCERPRLLSVRGILITRFRYNPISEQDFFDDIYTLFYSPDAGLPSDDPLLSHKLALLFMILAIGSLVDIKHTAYNIEAEKYHQLARASLFQSSLFEDPTISAVQSMACTFVASWQRDTDFQSGSSS